MQPIIAVGIFFFCVLAGVGVLMAGIGVYAWGKNKNGKGKTGRK